MAHQVDQDETSGRPRVWLVIGEKRGDNAQIVNLAEAVGWEYEVKTIVVKPPWAIKTPKVRPTLDHIDLERSDLNSMRALAEKRGTSVADLIRRAVAVEPDALDASTEVNRAAKAVR